MNYLILAVFTFSVSFLSLLAPTVYASETVELLLARSERKLFVKKDGETLKSYQVALGSGGAHKLLQGDNKTPTGNYRITKVRESDKFHLFLQLNYPNMSDATRALRSNTITREQYRTILNAHVFGQQPPQDTALGGAIGIHGIGLETEEKLRIHQNIDWTQGCIALRNKEVEELSQYVSVGTLINIID
jgi:murein L,D-transpeptidase YafK